MIWRQLIHVWSIQTKFIGLNTMDNMTSILTNILGLSSAFIMASVLGLSLYIPWRRPWRIVSAGQRTDRTGHFSAHNHRSHSGKTLLVGQHDSNRKGKTGGRGGCYSKTGIIRIVWTRCTIRNAWWNLCPIPTSKLFSEEISNFRLEVALI